MNAPDGFDVATRIDSWWWDVQVLVALLAQDVARLEWLVTLRERDEATA